MIEDSELYVIEGELISQEEGEKAVEAYIYEDFAVNEINLSRGHWEDIVHVIAKAQYVYMIQHNWVKLPSEDRLAEIMEWLDRNTVGYDDEAKELLKLLQKGKKGEA